MIEKTIRITNTLGLHMRPAKALCGKAMEFDSKITIRFRGKEFNAKSLLSVLSACVQQDDEFTLSCSGKDEADAAETLSRVLQGDAK